MVITKESRGVMVAMAAWSLVAIIPGAYLMASHLIALPTPSGGVKSATIEHAMATLRRPADRDRWMAAHVLLGTCGCSGRVLERLVKRGSRVAEYVLFIRGEDRSSDDEAIIQLRSHGFVVEALSADELGLRYSIESAPLLLVLTPTNRLVYVGGYTDQKQSAAIRDLEILDRLARGQTVAALPVFGCAVSSSLKKSLDPLGLRN